MILNNGAQIIIDEIAYRFVAKLLPSDRLEDIDTLLTVIT